MDLNILAMVVIQEIHLEWHMKAMVEFDEKQF